jgi:hypothetical protein
MCAHAIKNCISIPCMVYNTVYRFVCFVFLAILVALFYVGYVYILPRLSQMNDTAQYAIAVLSLRNASLPQ